MTKPTKKIFLWGYYGAKNVGDDLLLSLLIDVLLRYQDIKIQVVVSQSFEKPHADSNVDFITIPQYKPGQRLNFLRQIRFYVDTIKDNDIVIFGGGTSLFETENTKYKSLLVKYIILLWNRIILKRPVLHLGVGVGNVNTSVGKYCLKKILKFSDAINLREKKSYEKVVSLTKDKAKVSLGNDLAYLLPFASDSKDNTTYNIGISLFQYYGYISNDRSKADLFFNNCKAIIEELLAKDVNIQIHLFSLQKEHGGCDEEFNRKLQNEIASQRIHLHPYSNDTEGFIEGIRAMDFCFGMRLHFVILSVLQGIPVVGINYQPKVRNELASLGLSNFCLDIDRISEILVYVDSFLENKENFYAQYKDAFGLVRIKNEQTMNIISQILSPYLQ